MVSQVQLTIRGMLNKHAAFGGTVMHCWQIGLDNISSVNGIRSQAPTSVSV